MRAFFIVKRSRQFRAPGQPAPKTRQRQAERYRGSASSRGYGRKWQKARLQHLEENPLCLGCQAVGHTKAATIVDHVEPHEGDMVKFWNADMWQSCCKWHHDVIKQRLEASFASGRIGISSLWLNSEEAKALTEKLGGAPL